MVPFSDRRGDDGLRPLLATQFFSLINDHTLKQLVLLLALERVSRSSGSGGQSSIWFQGDMQGVAMIAFALPFLLLAGPAGWVADHVPRRRVIIFAKYVEIVIMLLVGLVVSGPASVFGQGDRLWWFFGLLIMMASQTAFMTPAKYAVVLDLFGQRRVSPVNGQMQTLAYLAIVAGAVAGGVLFTLLKTSAWMSVTWLVGIAALGTIAAHCIPRYPASQKSQVHSAATNLGSLGLCKTIAKQRDLREVMIVYGFVWLIASLYHPIINSFCRGSLQLTSLTTSLFLALSAVGIACGCAIAGWLHKRGELFGWLKPVACMLVICQGLLAVSARSVTIFPAGLLALLLFGLGTLTGMVVLPLHVAIQTRSPTAIRGQVLAVQGAVNWLAILLSGVVYQTFSFVSGGDSGTPGTLLAVLAILTLVGACCLDVTQDQLLRFPLAGSKRRDR